MEQDRDEEITITIYMEFETLGLCDTENLSWLDVELLGRCNCGVVDHGGLASEVVCRSTLRQQRIQDARQKGTYRSPYAPYSKLIRISLGYPSTSDSLSLNFAATPLLEP